MILGDNQNTDQSLDGAPEAPKNKIRIVFFVIFVIILIVTGLLFVRNFTKNNALSNDYASADLLPLNEQTKEYVVENINTLFKYIGLKGDAFNLDPVSESKLSGIVAALDASSSVIFNALGYKDIEKTKKGDSYYLRPKDSNISESEHLFLLNKEVIKPTDIINKNNNEIDRSVYELFYDDYAAGKTRLEITSALKAYLDKQVADKIITRYEYDEVDGNLTIYYPNEEIGFQSNPALYAQALDKIITSYGNPDSYTDKLIEDYRFKLSFGEALIINTKDNSTTTKLINSAVLENNLIILLDKSLTKEEKIKAIAGSLRLSGDIDSKVSFKPALKNLFGVNVVEAQSSELLNLLNRDFTIVPPNKTVHIIQGADNPSKPLSNYFIEETINPNGPFYAFHHNNYSFVLDNLRPKIGEQTIEKFANILSDDNSTNIMYAGHGNNKSLLMEVYYIGDTETLSEGMISKEIDQDIFTQIKKLRQRQSDLINKYGSNSINISYKDVTLSPEDLIDLSLADLRDAVSSKKYTFASINITNAFFEKYKSHKKSLMILDACYSGSLTSSFNSRVIITAPANSETSMLMFVSDLNKLAPYLYKNQDLMDIPIDRYSNRTYEALKDFKENYVINNSSTTKEMYDNFASRQDKCVLEKNSLCTVVLSGTVAGQTISVSPHVESVNNGEKITFNSPLETNNVDPGKVVTIDTSRCGTDQKVLDDNKPKWSGDKDIVLSWKDKIYRDWDQKDFNESGKPKVPYAVITVHNGLAVSKISKVSLTGNPDACTFTGCSQRESWSDPAGIEYNASQANSDFVMIRPCATAEYYKKCGGNDIIKISLNPTTQNEDILPQSIKVGGACYQMTGVSDDEKLKAKEIRDWDDGNDCTGLCSETTIKDSSDCMGHTLFSNRGKILLDGTNLGYYDTPLATFANHYAYIKHIENTDERLVKTQLIHDGFIVKDVYDYDTIPTESGSSNALGIKSISLYRDKIYFNGEKPKFLEDTFNYVNNSDYTYTFGHTIEQVGSGEGNSNCIDDKCEIDGPHIIYDGKDLGYGYNPVLFKDHIAYIRQKIILVKKEIEPGYYSYDNYTIPEIVIDGAAFDVLERLNLQKYSRNSLSINSLSIFENHIVFSLTNADDGTSNIYYDWKDKGLGYNPIIFDDNIVFQTNDGHIIYNDQDLGPGSKPKIYGNHLGFEIPTKIGDGITGTYYYDGNDYPYLTHISMPENLQACYIDYMTKEIKEPASSELPKIMPRPASEGLPHGEPDGYIYIPNLPGTAGVR